ncbi:MAG: geranylgeranylglycerol-phosphate geranylgeranyltransferase [Saprospiraceae bacterium]|nr:geranylgeranylglycerol-phosphate geranylgeranyltransferase [Saprospiraceae bacterium]
MKQLFRLVRFSNLIIIGFTLVILRYVSSPVYSDSKVFFVVLAGTILIAAAGNIINDILDLEIDLINKPHNVVIGNQINKNIAWGLYITFNSIALLLIVSTGVMVLFLVFLSAIILLFLYSYKFKKLAILGNLTVALLCSWVVIELLFIEYTFLSDYWIKIMYMYALFAFISTFGRELIKDIEDFEGDKKMGCKTLPVVAGVQSAKILVIISFSILLILLALEGYWFFLNNKIAVSVYIFVLLLLPLSFIILKLPLAKEKSDYTILSKLMKIYMTLGLGMLFFV